MDLSKLISTRIAQAAILTVTLIIVTITLYIHNTKSNVVKGTFTLYDSRIDSPAGEDCSGTGGYDDIRSGSSVTVKNGKGEIIAISNIDGGRVVRMGECRFTFEVKDVPRTDIYQFEVSKRGDVRYSHSSLRDSDYRIDLSLGD